MEHKDSFTSRLIAFEHIAISGKFMLRFFAVLTIVLAVLAGLGWERFSELSKKYAILQAKHDRLNKIYLQERKDL